MDSPGIDGVPGFAIALAIAFLFVLIYLPLRAWLLQRANAVAGSTPAAGGDEPLKPKLTAAGLALVVSVLVNLLLLA